MNSYKEKSVLIRLALVLLPFQVVGLLGIFFPWVFALVPVYASEICLCHFYSVKAHDPDKFHYLGDGLMTAMQITNVFSFNLMNFFFLYCMIFMVYKIRHINDCTMIKQECTVICLWWLFISTIEYLAFIAM
jgi:hypothetical protein